MAQQRGITREDSFTEALSQIPSTFDIFWGKGLNEEDFGETFMGDILEEVGGAGQVVAGFVDATLALVDLLSAAIQVTLTNLGIVVDLFEGVLTALNLILQIFREAITGISANFMFHFPSSHKARRTPSELMYDIGMSYLDKQDTKKPVSNLDNSAAVVVAIWSLADITSLIKVKDRLIKAIKGVNVSDIDDPRYKAGLYLRDEFVAEGTSSKPDWMFDLDLADIGAFKKLLNGITELMGTVDQKKSNLAKYNLVIDLVQQRLAKVSQITNELSDIITSITTLLALGDSNGMFVCKGKGTNRDFATTLINAPLHPDYPGVEFLETVDLNKSGNEINLELGRQSLFSGAMALHLQVVDASEDTFNAIVDLFAQQVQQLGTTGREPLAGSIERFNQIDISTNRNRIESED